MPSTVSNKYPHTRSSDASVCNVIGAELLSPMLYTLYCMYVNHVMYVRLAVHFSLPFVHFDFLILACFLDPLDHDYHHQRYSSMRTILYLY